MSGRGAPASLGPDAGARAGTRAAALSVAIGVTLSLLKLLAGWLGHSRAAFMDGVEAAGDVLVAAVVYGGFAYSLRPPDAEHPYGHRRAEGVAAVALSVALIASGLVSLGLLVALGPDAATAPSGWTIWPVLLTLPVKAALSRWKAVLGTRADSTTLRGDAFHDVADMLSSLLAAVGIYLAWSDPAHYAVADRLAGGAVGLLILLGGARLLRRSLSESLDEAPPRALVARIRAIAAATPGVAGVDKLLGRRAGTGYFVDLHVEVAPRTPISRAHRIGHEVKRRLLAHLPSVHDVLTHLEPARPSRGATPRRP